MMDAVIEVAQLTKRYGTHTAVDDVAFRCQAGTVTGFLGPNGAGKSTTMRMLCGLTPPTAGTATVAGRRYGEIPNPACEVGVLLDASAQHPGRTGREVLTLAAMTIGLDGARVPELLGRVGLDGKAAKRRVGGYSLGMRQRLGIALALLGEPRILVLDEPANGLDPEGIHWMRELLRDFAATGGTVLLSSHLLHEVEAIADRLLIIRQGKIIAEGTAAELLAGTGTVVRGLDPDALRAALDAAGLRWREHRDGGLHVEAEPEAVGHAAAAAGAVLVELRGAEGGRLEELFLQLTADPATDRRAA